MMTTREILLRTNAAKAALNCAGTALKNSALNAMAEALLNRQADILSANARDIEAYGVQLGPVMVDRLTLNPARIEGMAQGIRDVAALPDPVGRVLEEVARPNGLVIRKTAVPMGVVAIIFESRPNVTADAAALALKSGNACVLRGGKESYHSNAAIVAALRAGVESAGLPGDLIGLVEDTTRQSAAELMTANGLVDLLIPRGGAGLIRACVENATVPCVQTGTGICHVYVDAAADQTMALNIIENAKTSRPSVCNAEEVCLVHRSIAAEFLPKLHDLLAVRHDPRVELRLCPQAQKLIPGTPAGERDFDTEFLDYILAIKVVDSLEDALAHIAAHSTGHSDAIITADAAAADAFVRGVDSAAGYVNASTRFTDGGEFGLGCEMGISTQKLHARGPMGLQELCTYKYVVLGEGQVR